MAWNARDAFVSRDGGGTFQEVQGGALVRLTDADFDGFGNLVYAGSRGLGVQRTDGSEHWVEFEHGHTVLPSGTASALLSRSDEAPAVAVLGGGPLPVVLAVYIDSDMVEHNALRFSPDPGQTWQAQRGIDQDGSHPWGLQHRDGSVGFGFTTPDCRYDNLARYWLKDDRMYSARYNAADQLAVAPPLVGFFQRQCPGTDDGECKGGGADCDEMCVLYKGHWLQIPGAEVPWGAGSHELSDWPPESAGLIATSGVLVGGPIPMWVRANRTYRIDRACIK